MEITCFENRELSWLRFNERVLEEAEDERVPLCERLSFLSIFQSNLDEFFMVRIGSLHDQMLLDKEARENKTLMTPGEQIDAAMHRIRELCHRRDKTYAALLAKLEEQPLVKAQSEKLTDKTTIVPTIASIMPDSVANSVFGNELTRLVNGVISPEQFCSTLTVKAQEAKD